MAEETIICPNCGVEIPISEVLTHQIRDRLKSELEAGVKRREAKLNEQAQKLSQEKEQIEELVNERMKAQLAKIQAQAEEKANEKVGIELGDLKNQVDEKNKQIAQAQQTELELRKQQRELEEGRKALELEVARKLAEEKEKVRQEALQQFGQEHQLKDAEREKTIKDLQKALDEARRKAAQGSMQLQGEVQELAIEEWLMEHYPLDTIEEIKKGARGADCLQIVNTRTRQNCGRVYYESKRTKDFQPSWIEKFKNDIRDKGADIGVLVTQSMPSDMERMGFRDGIWICTFEEFKSLSAVLRQSVIRLSEAVATQENKGDKMAMLYDFLTSNEFALQIGAIMEGFDQMHQDLEREKRSMQGIWKRREKQIEKVLLNTNYMYNSIKGIAGNAIQPVKLLELHGVQEEADQSSFDFE